MRELSRPDLEVITSAIERHLNRNQKVLRTVIRTVVERESEKTVEGYIEIPCAVTRNNCLFDFEIMLGEGALVRRLSVNGSKVFDEEE